MKRGIWAKQSPSAARGWRWRTAPQWSYQLFSSFQTFWSIFVAVCCLRGKNQQKDPIVLFFISQYATGQQFQKHLEFTLHIVKHSVNFSFFNIHKKPWACWHPTDPCHSSDQSWQMGPEVEQRMWRFWIVSDWNITLTAAVMVSMLFEVKAQRP